jgi:hypothetical protein
VTGPGRRAGAGGSPAVPPGWPGAVRPPGAPDWERSAVAWLLDLCPPEYRGHPVLLRRPVALAWVAGRHVDAALVGTRRALGGVRAALSDALEPPALTALIEALESEEARFVAASRGVGLVEEALRGRRHVPRL